MTDYTETTYLAWGCQGCNKTYKVQPEVFKPNCRCEKPVPRLRPTIETQVQATPHRALRLVDEDDRVAAEIATVGVDHAYTANSDPRELVVQLSDGRCMVIRPEAKDLHR